MGWFYLDDPKGRDLVAHWKDRPGMVGLRFCFNERHKREWVMNGTLNWLWPAAERAGVPVALAAALFLPTVGQIAERHPGLRLIVDHMAVPPGRTGEAAYRFQPELLALANTRTWRSRRRVKRATPRTRIPSAAFSGTCPAASARSARSECSGAPTSPGCRAHGGNA